ncbi:cell envelope integrity protein TolA [Chitinibacter sp. SCUT-21]|uniref:cell envelope integrity protein TolA n=1 Tax=Chitinibacter sp. SCUT-21 TaxID=2970891 RepID=UPI0035A5A331
MNQKQNPAHAERRGLSFVLAVVMHVILAAALLLSVQWKTQKPAPVVVELWGGPPPAAPEQAQPEPVKQKPVKLEPPKPEVVPEKVDIATEKVKTTPKPTVKPTATPKVTAAPTATPKATAKATAVKAAQQAPVKPTAKPAKPPKNEEPTSKDLLALDNVVSGSKSDSRPAAGGKPGGTGNNPNATSGMGSGSSGLGRGYVDGIGNRIKLNIVYPNEMVGNPEVIYKIMLFPTGEVRDIQLLKASGNKAWDDAVKNAIQRSAPFQKPPNNASFSEFSGVEWKFRPK